MTPIIALDVITYLYFLALSHRCWRIFFFSLQWVARCPRPVFFSQLICCHINFNVQTLFFFVLELCFIVSGGMSRNPILSARYFFFFLCLKKKSLLLKQFGKLRLFWLPLCTLSFKFLQLDLLLVSWFRDAGFTTFSTSPGWKHVSLYRKMEIAQTS